MADIAGRARTWLHVDAAYAGAVALLPELRAPFQGWERADSIVVNPHKWLFTPLDASLLLTRRMDRLAAAFSLHPEYLRTLDRMAPVRDYTDYTPQLGRRMRALKLWIQLRWFGLEGMRRRIRHHLELAADLAAEVVADPDWELLAPVPFSTVCLRWRPARFEGREGDEAVATALDARECRDHRCGEPLRGGVPVAYAPRRSLHHSRRDRQPANASAPRPTRLGVAPRGRSDRRGDDGPAVSPAPDPARRHLLREPGRAACVVRGAPRLGGRAVGRLPPQGHGPADDHLAASRRRGAVRRLDRRGALSPRR